MNSSNSSSRPSIRCPARFNDDEVYVSGSVDDQGTPAFWIARATACASVAWDPWAIAHRLAAQLRALELSLHPCKEPISAWVPGTETR